MYKSYRLNKLTRLNELLALNKKTKISVQKSKPKISKETTNSNDSDDSSKASNVVDGSSDINSIKNSIVPTLQLSQYENNVTLVWHLYDDISQKKLTSQHSNLKFIKEYEVFGIKKAYNKELENNLDMLGSFDKSQWLSVIKIFFIFLSKNLMNLI